MTNILCFGDSNTYGYKPGGAGRFNEQERYPTILSSYLGDNYKIYENGLVGRATIFDDDARPERLGLNDIGKAVATSRADILIIALGTNDVKKMFDATGEDIASGVETLINVAKTINAKIRTIIVTPAPISSDALMLSDDYNDKSLNVSLNLCDNYRNLADKLGAGFIDIGEFATVSPVDGEHITAQDHAVLAKRLANLIKSMN